MKGRLRGALLALGLTAVLASAAPALAKPGHGRGQGGERPRNPVVMYLIRGKVKAVEGEVVTVTVERSNRHGRRMRGQDVPFDVSRARIGVRDRNGDGERNLADVIVGDDALVQARMPRRPAADATGPFRAKKLIAKAPEPEVEDEATEGTAPPAS